MLDRYLTGVVDRISPEAPIQVLRVESEMERLGGAGSVATNVAVLGARDDPRRRAGRRRGAAGSPRMARQARASGSRRSSTRRGGRASRRATSRGATRQRPAGPARGRGDGAARSRADGGGARCARASRPRSTAPTRCSSATTARACSRPTLLAAADRRRRARGGIPVVVDPKGDDFSATAARPASRPTAPRPAWRPASRWRTGDLDAAERAAARLVEGLGLDFVLHHARPGGHVPQGRAGGAGRAPPHDAARGLRRHGRRRHGALGARASRSRAGATPAGGRGARQRRGRARGRALRRRAASRARRSPRGSPSGGGAPSAEACRSARARGRRCGRRRAAGPARSCSRTAASTSCTPATSATCRPRAREGDVLVVGPQLRRQRAAPQGRGRAPSTARRTASTCCRRWPCVDHVVVFDEDTPLSPDRGGPAGRAREGGGLARQGRRRPRGRRGPRRQGRPAAPPRRAEHDARPSSGSAAEELIESAGPGIADALPEYPSPP